MKGDGHGRGHFFPTMKYWRNMCMYKWKSFKIQLAAVTCGFPMFSVIIFELHFFITTDIWPVPFHVRAVSCPRVYFLAFQWSTICFYDFNVQCLKYLHSHPHIWEIFSKFRKKFILAGQQLENVNNKSLYFKTDVTCLPLAVLHFDHCFIFWLL